MISYEKIRQSFQKWTSILSILYFVNAFIFLLTTLGSLSNKLILEKQPDILSTLGQEKLALLKMITTPFALGTFILGLIITLIIGILSLINRGYAKRKQDKNINISIYYIAITWAILSVFLEFLYLGTIAPSSPITMLFFGFANLFTLNKGLLLKEQD